MCFMHLSKHALSQTNRDYARVVWHPQLIIHIHISLYIHICMYNIYAISLLWTGLHELGRVPAGFTVPENVRCSITCLFM